MLELTGYSECGRQKCHQSKSNALGQAICELSFELKQLGLHKTHALVQPRSIHTGCSKVMRVQKYRCTLQCMEDQSQSLV